MKIKAWAPFVRPVGFVCTVLAFASCSAKPQPNATEHTARLSSDLSSPVPQLGTFLLYAERSVQLGGSDLSAFGDVGVHRAAPASFGSQLSVGSFSLLTGNVFAPSVSLGLDSQVGNVETSTLQNSGGFPGSVSPFPASTMPSLPLQAPATPGVTPVSVAASQSVVLAPGNYADANVAGTLVLEPGVYSFSSVTLAPQAQLVSHAGLADVRVSGQFVAGQGTAVQGDTAALLSLSVAGGDVATSTPAAFTIGQGSEVTALVSAPHGTLSLGAQVVATGAFSAFDIVVGDQCNIAFDTGFSGGTQPGQQGQQQLSGYITPALAAAPLVGPVPPSTPIHLAIGLPVQNAATPLATFVDQVSNPTSPTYRQYLDPPTFAATYGAAPSDYNALSAFATSAGLTVTSNYPTRLLLDVSGPASAIEQAFYLDLNYYLRPDGTQFFAPDREPSFDLATTVLRISGLDNAFVTTPYNPGSAPSNGYISAADLRAAYVPCATQLTGAGQAIALVSWSGFQDSDIVAYDVANGLPENTPVVNLVNIGGLNSNDPSGETALDIEMAMAMAPGAEVLLFEGPYSNSSADTNDMFTQMAGAVPLPNQISSSWAFYADQNTSQVLAQLAAQGQSFFTSSGDSGAYLPAGPSIYFPGPSPAEVWQPYLTIVGGSVLTMLEPGGGTCNPGDTCTYGSEQAWPGGGGGILDFGSAIGLPAYQVGLANAANLGSTLYRMVPDVSAVAKGVDIFWSPNSVTSGSLIPKNGTSISSPVWAGFTALANEQIVNLGFHGAIGFANPVLYAIAASPAQAAGLAFNDIASGNNGYPAVAGYDLATGLGTPTCGLINQLASATPTVPVECPPGVTLCGLVCCPSGSCDNSTYVCLTPPAFEIEASATPLFTFGVDTCLSGTGFTPNNLVQIEIDGIPGGPDPFLDQERADGSGNISAQYNELGTTFNCTPAQAAGTVTVRATPTASGTGQTTTTTLPACIWCANPLECPGIGTCP